MPIKINVEKALEIHKDHIRSARNPLLQEKDVQYMRALESGDTEKASEIAAAKQELRDATKMVDGVEISGTSVSEVTQEIKQIWNESILGTNPLL